jgi:hypothetical protein
MINKLVIKGIIDKYYLGEIQSVKWVVKDGNLEIPFMSPSKELIGKITHSNFNIENCELAIFDTKKLSNLISITHGDLLFNLEKTNSVYTKMHFEDEIYSLTYALADPLLIGKVGQVQEPEWDCSIDLTTDNLHHIVKAKNALSGENNTNVMTTHVEEDINGVLQFVLTFGDEHGHNNKVKYQLEGELSKNLEMVPYNSDIFRNILNVNKDMQQGKMLVSYKGLIKLEFKVDEVTSTYYLVRRESTNF